MVPDATLPVFDLLDVIGGQPLVATLATTELVLLFVDINKHWGPPDMLRARVDLKDSRIDLCASKVRYFPHRTNGFKVMEVPLPRDPDVIATVCHVVEFSGNDERR
jgi:hypothetical protein